MASLTGLLREKVGMNAKTDASYFGMTSCGTVFGFSTIIPAFIQTLVPVL